MTAWDAKVGNASIIEGIALRGSLKGFLVFKDAVLKTSDLFCESMVLHHSIGFMIGDGSEKSIHNSAKEHCVDVIVGSKGRLDRPRRHCWWDWSHRARDWKGSRRFGRRDVGQIDRPA